jgi:hypothetical protein
VGGGAKGQAALAKMGRRPQRRVGARANPRARAAARARPPRLHYCVPNPNAALRRIREAGGKSAETMEAIANSKATLEAQLNSQR